MPVKTSVVVSKRVASDPAVCWGITTSIWMTLPADAVPPAIKLRLLSAAVLW